MPNTAPNPIRRWLYRPVWLKLVLIAVLTAVLLVPINMTEALVLERRGRMDDVIAEFGNKWGNELTLRGPVLEAEDQARYRRVFLLPEKVTNQVDIRVEKLHRGIFTVPTYRATVTMAGTFDLTSAIPPFGVVPPGSPSTVNTTLEPTATLQVLFDPGRLPPNQSTLSWNGRAVTPTFAADNGQGVLSAEVSIPGGRAATAVPFELKLEVQGITTLQLAPLGRTSRTVMTSAWPDPSFTGDRLPSQRTVGRKGFVATWELSAASLGVPAATFANTIPAQLVSAPAVGVRFVDPVDHYLQVTRAVKHAVLIILLTFASLFLLEILAGVRVHPVQYLLVGCALTVFYLLLLSLSEQFSFSIAYAGAAGAVVLLIATYTAAVLGRWLRGLGVAGGLASVYGILFVILRAEQLALLAGSLTVFAALAALMLSTRKVDWYALDQRGASTPRPPPYRPEPEAGKPTSPINGP